MTFRVGGSGLAGSPLCDCPEDHSFTLKELPSLHHWSCEAHVHGMFCDAQDGINSACARNQDFARALWNSPVLYDLQRTGASGNEQWCGEYVWTLSDSTIEWIYRAFTSRNGSVFPPRFAKRFNAWMLVFDNELRARQAKARSGLTPSAKDSDKGCVITAAVYAQENPTPATRSWRGPSKPAKALDDMTHTEREHWTTTIRKWLREGEDRIPKEQRELLETWIRTFIPLPGPLVLVGVHVWGIRGWVRLSRVGVTLAACQRFELFADELERLGLDADLIVDRYHADRRYKRPTWIYFTEVEIARLQPYAKPFVAETFAEAQGPPKR